MSCQKKTGKWNFQTGKNCNPTPKILWEPPREARWGGRAALGVFLTILTILFLSMEKSVKIMKFDVSEGFVEISIMTLEKIS